MKVGTDLDGTLACVRIFNPNIRVPAFLFVFIVPLVFIAVPNKKAARKIKELKTGGSAIVIVSARPAWSTRLTIWWLRHHSIPFDKLFCVGFGAGTKERKLEVIQREEIDLFFDDDRQIIDFLKENLIDAGSL
jgi:hypothetical protein